MSWSDILLAVMEPGGAMMPMGGEPLDLPESDKQMKAAKWRTDMPVMVLARGSRSFSVDNFPPALREYAPQGESLRMEMQRDLAARSSRGKLIIAEKSGHFIHHDEPALVIDAIRKVLNSIGQK